MSWAIRVRDAGKVFVREDDSVVDVLDRLSLEIAEGSFVTIVGRSGCGKSTLLNMVAGLVEPSSGTIEFSDGTSRRPHPQV
ncbi:MAG TPA: ATP-binding cassette domain-containing protein, partial [Candidatus Acidoferrales bacterium]|nr:ATP-binding cassette domain-containing protein [Candidatus Acidoferrales bacterium]